MIKKIIFIPFGAFLLIAAFQYFYTGAADAIPSKTSFEIIAHRGVHQDFHRDNLDNSTCTASRIFKPTHHYIENTVESIQAAFDLGATMVEIDIRPTSDDQLVVFHDNRLECRTNAQGHLGTFTLEELRKLDISYGYTYDGGKTFPFRGQGIGKIQTLRQVLNRFPDKRFLLDNKSGNNLDVAKLIADELSRLPIERQRQIYLWTQDAAFDYIHQRLPAIDRLLLPRPTQKRFFKAYLLSLGLMNIGEEYHNQGLGLPIEYTKLVWGWPYRFLSKAADANTRFYLFLNTTEELESISRIPLDGIITDHIDVLGPHLNH